MTDLISRDEVVGKLEKAYFDKNLQEAKNDPCVIDAMTDWAIRQVKNIPSYSPWHTGTPTEEGWYLLKMVDEYGRITYGTNYLRNGIKGMEWKYAFFGHVIIKWQSIEDEPEVMMG